jgi:hypothetical protein
MNDEASERQTREASMYQGMVLMAFVFSSFEVIIRSQKNAFNFASWDTPN